MSKMPLGAVMGIISLVRNFLHCPSMSKSDIDEYTRVSIGKREISEVSKVRV